MGIARNSAFDSAAQIAAVAVSFLSGIVVSRSLGSGGRGSYVLATIVLSGLVVSLVQFGLPAACQYAAARRPGRAGSVHRGALVLSGAIGLLAGGVLVLLGLVVPALVRGIGLSAWLLFAATLPALLYQGMWRGIMNAIGEIRLRAGFDLLHSALHGLAIVGGVLAVAGERRVAVLIGAYYALSWILAGLMFAKSLRLSGLRGTRGRVPVRALLRYGKWVWLGESAFALRGTTDQVLVGTFGSPAALGVYNQAASLATRSGLFTTALRSAVWQSAVECDKRESARIVALAFRQSLALGIAFSALAWVCAPLIPLIYGGDFSAAVAPFRILVPALFLLNGSRLLGVYFSGRMGNPRIEAAVTWFAVLVQTGGALAILATMETVAGMTIAASVACAAAFALRVALFVRWTGMTAATLLTPGREDLAAWRNLVRGFRGR